MKKFNVTPIPENKVSKEIAELAERRGSITSILIIEVQANGQAGWRAASLTQEGFASLFSIAMRAGIALAGRMDGQPKEEPRIEVANP